MMDVRVEEPGGPDAVSTDPCHPVYQVNVYRRLASPEDVPQDRRPFLVSEWKLYDADVQEVMQWAAENAGDQYTVNVATAGAPEDSCLIRLWGDDPTMPAGIGGPYRAPIDPVDSY